MDHREAQTALDDIRRRQRQTTDEYVRRSYSPKAVIASAVALFAVYASFDLPGDYWPVLVAAVSVAVLGGWALTCRHRAAVRHRPSRGQVAFYVLVAIGIAATWLVSLAATRALGLPAPHTLAAAATALASVAAAGPLSRIFASILAAEAEPR